MTGPRAVAVSGSASGMGAAVRKNLEHSGCRVIGIDLHDAEVPADLSSASGRADAASAVADLAEGRLDGLVACAGLGPHVHPVSAVVRVNYFGAVSLLDGLLPQLRLGESPSAVVIASNGASLTPEHTALVELLDRGDEDAAAALGEELGGIVAYGMSKLGLVRAIRRRSGPWGREGVRLNAVAPGPIDTPMLEGIMADASLGPIIDSLPIPLGRRGEPEEIARAVAFLLDPSNSYIHGSVLFVDGGSDAQLRPEAI